MIEEIINKAKIVKYKPVSTEREHFGENCQGKFNIELGVGLHCPECGRWFLGEGV